MKNAGWQYSCTCIIIHWSMMIMMKREKNGVKIGVIDIGEEEEEAKDAVHQEQ